MTDLDLVLNGAQLHTIEQRGNDIQITTADYTLVCAEARIVNSSAMFGQLPVELDGSSVAWWATAPGGLVLATTRGEYLCIETQEVTCARAAS